ncbi:MAG: hypothetical protein JW910_15120, partial [Anaerolineae bacterium]|nr:hypothetical protein [Anaerolineae bacterium]
DYLALPGIAQDNVITMQEWPGYYGGAPSLAEADLGEALLVQYAYRATSLIKRALAGDNLNSLPIYPAY